MSERATAGRQDGSTAGRHGVPPPVLPSPPSCHYSQQPRQYAEGVAGFRLLDLAVDRRVLIPRPETEGLVELVLAWCTGSRNRAAEGASRSPMPDARHLSVLEIGTGSGCIALSLAQEGRFGRIVATDVSPDALDVARANLAAIQPPVAPEFRLGSLFQPVAGERFDVIVSNPPYVTDGEFAELDPSVRAWEPRVALVSGPDGLAHTRAILRCAGAHLTPSGLLALEVDCRRADAAAEEARAAGWHNVRVLPDPFGRLRYLLGRKDAA